MYWIVRLLILAIFVLNNQMLWAQELPCGDKFETINSSCIYTNGQKRLQKITKKIKIIIPTDNKEILHDTYFYQTGAGNLGKLKIISSISNSKECTLYLEATTYTQGRSFNPSATFSITNEFNTWNTDTQTLDQARTNDFTLRHNKGICVFEATDAKAFFYGKLVDDSLSKGGETLYYTALFLIGLAAFLISRSFFEDEEKYKAQATLDEVDEQKENQLEPDIVLKYSRPFFKRYLSPIVQGMKNKKNLKDKYKRKLASSGQNKLLTPEDFFAFKLFLIIGFPILFLGVRGFLEETWPLILIPVISLIGYFYPDIWINGKIEKRKYDITKNMPFIVDMLALSVEAGLDFVAAMTKVIEKAPRSALVEEFETMIKETKVGASRAEALRQLSWRCDTIQIASFCATLIAADSVGANIAPILKTLAGEMRQKRSAEAEKKGATAATKILFPMMIFVLPSVGIIVAAPIMIGLIA